jgi:hypothetical protein
MAWVSGSFSRLSPTCRSGIARAGQHRPLALQDHGDRLLGQVQGGDQGLEALQGRGGNDHAGGPAIPAADRIRQRKHPESAGAVLDRIAQQQPGQTVGLGQQEPGRRQPSRRLLLLRAGKTDHPAVPVHHRQSGILAADGFGIGEEGFAAPRIQAADFHPAGDVSQPLLGPGKVALGIDGGHPGPAIGIASRPVETGLGFLKKIVGECQQEGHDCRHHQETQLGPNGATRGRDCRSGHAAAHATASIVFMLSSG